MATKSKSRRIEASSEKSISGCRVDTNHEPVTPVVPSPRRNYRWRFRDVVSPEKLVSHLQFMRLFPTLEPGNRLTNWGGEEIFAVGQQVRNEILEQIWRPRLPFVTGNRDGDPHDLTLRCAVDQGVIALIENMLWQLLEEVWPPAVMTRRGRGVHSTLILMGELVEEYGYQFCFSCELLDVQRPVSKTEISQSLEACGVDGDLQSLICSSLFKGDTIERKHLSEDPWGRLLLEILLHRGIDDADESEGMGTIVKIRCDRELILMGDSQEAVQSELRRVQRTARGAGIILGNLAFEHPFRLTEYQLRLSDFLVVINNDQLQIEFEEPAYKCLEQNLERTATSGDPSYWAKHGIEQWMAHFVPGFQHAGHDTVVSKVVNVVERTGFLNVAPTSQIQAVLQRCVRCWEAKKVREPLEHFLDD